MDAITLSTSKLGAAGRLVPNNGWRLNLLAALSNLAFKGVLVAFLGDRQLLLRIAALFGLTIAGGLLVFWLWPTG